MKYRVHIPYLVYCNVDVFANDEDDAIEIAYPQCELEAAVGNGGGGSKMIAVSGADASISFSTEPLFLDDIKPECFEIGDGDK